MSISSVRTRVNSIETELQLLKTEIEKTPILKEKARSFSQLEGIWSKEKELAKEEIDRAKIALPKGW
ncbi:hypothetical protein KJ693_06105 [bacterium]|nr:hypothetical protein [bacterium]MBU1614873.1 hypothetical protein [bacterium]